METPPPPPPASALVAHWRFDEGQGQRAADSSPAGNHGTLTGGASFVSPGCPLAKFPNPAAVSLDGQAEVVAGVARLPRTDAAKTISLWVRAPGPAATTQAYLSLTNRALGCGVQIGVRGRTLAVWKWGGEVMVSMPAPGTGWHHVFYAFDGTNHRLRLDGATAVVSTAVSQSCAVAEAVVGNYLNGGNHYVGEIDDLRIYDRALSETEAAQLARGENLPGEAQ